MIDLSKYLHFIIADFTPGFMLTIDIFMLIDNLTRGALKALSVDSIVLIYVLTLLAIVVGIIQTTLIFTLYDPIFIKICGTRFWEPVTELHKNTLTNQVLFSNLIVPTFLFGIVFPRFIGYPQIQPYFFVSFFVVSFVLFILSIYLIKIYKKGIGFYR